MTDSHIKYHLVPSESENHDHSSDGGNRGDDSFSSSERIQTEVPTKWTYFLLGCAILLPWNALINGTPFFLSQLVGSPFYATFTSCLSSVYTLSNLVCQLYSTFTSKQSSPSRRIFTSVVAAMLLVTSLYFSTFVRATPLTFFVFGLFNAAALAATSGYMCTAVYAGASILGTSFLQTVISGQAAVAVGVSLVQVVSSVISLWVSSPRPFSMEAVLADGGNDHPEELAARIFFGVSTVFLSVTLIAYWWLTRQPFYKSFTSTLEPHGEVGDADEFTSLIANDRRNPAVESNLRVFHVFRRNLTFLFSIAYTFAVTLAVYPAVTVRVQPVTTGVRSMLFIAVHFLAFNSGDLIGRYACSFPRMIVWSSRKILAMSFSRTLFIPLILLCNIHRPVTASPVSPIINSDILFMLILLTMGWTNGYVSTMGTLAVSSLEHNPGLEHRRDDVDIAATLGGSFVIVGLAVGALCSFAVQAMA